MGTNDDRWQPMCCHYLSDSPCTDSLLGAEECRSPFGTYELSMPIDENASCDPNVAGITDKNCKDFNVSIADGCQRVLEELFARCPVTDWDLSYCGITTTAAVKDFRSLVGWHANRFSC